MAWMETADLWVRPSQEADLELFYQWERRPEVTQFFSIADGQSRAEVEAIYRRDAADPGRRQYTILLKPEGRPIGRIVLADRIEGWKVEIFRIYIADTALRGKGYGKQAMQAILKQCFEAWGGSIWTIIPAIRPRSYIGRWGFSTRGSCEGTAGKTGNFTTCT